MDAVILAVAHDEFAHLSQEDFDQMFKQTENEHKVLLDIKGILNRKSCESAGYVYWRL